MAIQSPKWWLLAAGAILFLVVLTLLERWTSPTPVSTAREADSPLTADVRRGDDGAVEIHYPRHASTRLVLTNEAKKQALFECLQDALDGVYADGTPGHEEPDFWRAVQEAKERCMNAARDATAPDG